MMATASKNPKQARGGEARQKLLFAAVELFAEHGYEGASTREIAAAAKQNIAAISYYFGDKEGLYAAVLEEFFRRKHAEAGASITAARALRDDPARTPERILDEIRNWLRASVMSLAQEDRLSQGFVKLMMREQFAPTKTFKKFFARVSDPAEDPFAMLVAAYLERDPDAVETFLITHALVGPYIGFIVAPEIVRIRTGWKKIGAAEVAQIADVVLMQMEITLAGLRNKKAGAKK
jgi:AcrR family transcriptional regulator